MTATSLLLLTILSAFASTAFTFTVLGSDGEALRLRPNAIMLCSAASTAIASPALNATVLGVDASTASLLGWAASIAFTYRVPGDGGGSGATHECLAARLGIERYRGFAAPLARVTARLGGIDCHRLARLQRHHAWRRWRLATPLNLFTALLCGGDHNRVTRLNRRKGWRRAWWWW